MSKNAVWLLEILKSQLWNELKIQKVLKFWDLNKGFQITG